MISTFVAVLRNNSHCNRSFFCNDAEIFFRIDREPVYVRLWRTFAHCCKTDLHYLISSLTDS